MKTSKEIYEWLDDKNYPTFRDQDDVEEGYYREDMPEILNAFANQFTPKEEHKWVDVKEVNDFCEKMGINSDALISAYKAFLQNALDEVNSEEEDKWIDVKEFPDRDGAYLVVNTEYEPYVAWFNQIGFWFEGQRVYPSHYRPLPLPPKKEKGMTAVKSANDYLRFIKNRSGIDSPPSLKQTDNK